MKLKTKRLDQLALDPPKSTPTKKIRVFINDPDATDDDDDEEQNITRKNHHCFLEFEVKKKPRIPAVPKTPAQKRFSSDGFRPKIPGVRQRAWGRWSAEIRDPIRRLRLWLGTYDTAHEAAEAHRKAQARLDAERTKLPHLCAASTSVSSCVSESLARSAGAASARPLSAVGGRGGSDWAGDGGDGPWDERERSGVELLDEALSGPDSMLDFGLESDPFLVGQFDDDDLIRLDDLPLWNQLDGGDFSFLDECNVDECQILAP